MASGIFKEATQITLLLAAAIATVLGMNLGIPEKGGEV